jgi:hypothetical protein
MNATLKKRVNTSEIVDMLSGWKEDVNFDGGLHPLGGRVRAAEFVERHRLIPILEAMAANRTPCSGFQFHKASG